MFLGFKTNISVKAKIHFKERMNFNKSNFNESNDILMPRKHVQEEFADVRVRMCAASKLHFDACIFHHPDACHGLVSFDTLLFLSIFTPSKAALS